MTTQNIQLFPMQVDAVKSAMDYYNDTSKASQHPVIMVAPTAYGKSIIVSELARLIGEVLVIQPSKELLEQNYSKLIMLGGQASIYSASMNTKEVSSITYATIGSIKDKAHLFKNVKCVIVDEAHTFPVTGAAMFGGFIRELGVKKVIGLTATPFRLNNYMGMDGNPYSKLSMMTSKDKGCGYFKDIIYCCQIGEIIASGRWSKLEYAHYDFVSTLLRVNSSGAEYTEKSVIDAYKANGLSERIADHVNKCASKAVVVFVPLVQMAYEVSGLIRNSAVVHGDMDKNEREWTINNFKSGKIKCVVNVGVLSIGFDYPQIDEIVLGRPTMSLAWLYQAIGRGTRIHPQKEKCIISDFVGVTKRFGKIENLVIDKREGKYEVFSGQQKLSSTKLIDLGKRDMSVEELANEPTMPFGKHQGVGLSRLPESYMGWMLENFNGWSAYGLLRKQFEDELRNRQSVFSN